MERLKNAYKNMSLLRSFTVTVFFTFGAVFLLSLLVIWGCSYFRNRLLPDSGAVFLTVRASTTDGEVRTYSARLRLGEEETGSLSSLVAMDGNGDPIPVTLDPTKVSATVAKADSSYTMLTPKRKLAYRICGVVTVTFPALLSVVGVLFCGFFFYRHKLAPPLKILRDATEKIADKNLDFEIPQDSEDELGTLCRSFEEMRRALSLNNREMWKMIEERKLLQSSVAHDLRNPIAIIEGYAEYLELHARADDLTPQKTLEMIGNISRAAKRLEQYTESVRRIDQLGEIEVCRRTTTTEELISALTADLTVMAADAGKSLAVTNEVPPAVISADASVLHRVLENIVGNAGRAAEEKIELSFAMCEGTLAITVADDGNGFPEEILIGKNMLMLPKADEGGHCGIGLTVSRILCRKHGGSIELSNRVPHGAAVKIFFEV